ncbi:hypothetical protein [Kingella kingae]|uniref:hypothetical protein n=1 Tax=Kingella kingae TaxID=504 RepID=UPI0004263A65|nr:hypothetical protein [Kingella kingae]MDK4623933.1 hypothetical protein [Kingella kingae]MDK4659559.1 hypothetical protein [Kingella kingae]MDK4667466.1 hypothetical protein [Kingella kingae]MDK4685836.1 hypothetical protein [Kingella kingae]
MKAHLITLTTLSLLALSACSDTPPASPQKTEASAPASSPAVASEPVAQTSTASAAATPVVTASPAEQAKQLHDAIERFKDEAAQRVVEIRKTTMQPSTAQTIEIIRAEAAAIRQAAQDLQQLPLADAEVVQTRDLFVNYMTQFVEATEVQIQAADLIQQGKQSEVQAITANMDTLPAAQEAADKAYADLLKKYQIAQ